MENETMQGLQQNPPANPSTVSYAAEALRVRCPHCRKLYLVQFNDIREAKPRFECVQCHERFWLSLGEMDLSGEVVGLPVTVKEVPSAVRARSPAAPVPAASSAAAATEPCPKCFKANAVGARECQHCGVAIDKVRAALDFKEPVPTHSTALAVAWKRVMDDYENEDLHQEFLRLAAREYNLPYAGAVYAQMRKLMPTDEITRKRIHEIQAMGSVALPPRPPPRSTNRSFGYPRLWQVPLFGAAFMIVVGLTIPFFRNLVGVGAAFLFLAIALRIQMKR